MFVISEGLSNPWCLILSPLASTLEIQWFLGTRPPFGPCEKFLEDGDPQCRAPDSARADALCVCPLPKYTRVIRRPLLNGMWVGG